MCSECRWDIWDEDPPCRNCGEKYEECDCGSYDPMSREDLEEGDQT